jgi:wobble nucleotide-excising tRNase
MTANEYEIALELVKQNLDKINQLIPPSLRAREESLYENLTNSNLAPLKRLEALYGEMDIIYNFVKQFSPCKKGYIIKRDGQFANNLSEGEKTAIAFSYFVVKVQERNFKIRDGIVFIDDPISSLDSNFIYHCFSLIKNHFVNAGQLFVSTHNFELFNLLKKWLLDKNRNRIKKKKDEVCNFYMVENYIDADKRQARLKVLDNTLLKYNSEYHFLFEELHNFVQNESPEYKDLYTIGNIARRFLEIFTNFKIPTTGDLASKIEALDIDTAKISKIEQGKVYKLIQEFSHGSDPTSAIEHKDKIESQEAIKVLLNMVKESDPRHYDLLEKVYPDT